MLSFKDLQEVLQPKAAGEKRFKDKHVADTIDYPLNDAEINKGTKKSPAKKKRIADSEEGKDAAVYEENEKMTPAQEKKREEIVMAMKKDKEKLQSRYGESWKAVMYATATKQAMSESVDLDEDVSVYKKTARKNKNDVTYAFGRTKKLDGQPKEKGGYWVWKLSKNYDGKVRGGIRNSWVYVEKDLSYSDAVKLMNKKLGRKEFKEEVELDEAKYELYHKDFSSAMQHAYHVAKKHHGITIDPEEIDDKVATGPRKPSEGKTNTYRLKGDKGAVQIQVYNRGGSKPFELNMYKEEVELDEAQKMFMFKTKAEAEKKAKEIKGVMTELGPKNFMVVTKDLTKVPSKAKMKFGKDKDVTPKGYGPNEELDESAAGIAQLKKAYEPLRGKKISLDNAKKLSAIMNKFADDKAMLQKLAKADIPFVSSKAVTILITKHNMKGAEINKMRKEEVGLDEAWKVGETVKYFGRQVKITKVYPNGGYQIDGKTNVSGNQLTTNSTMKNEDIDLDEAFKINATNQKLDDGSMVNISKDDASALNGLYNSLNPANAKTMIKKMMQDKKTYGEILAFAKQAM
jgi:hypothetical protein